MQTSAPTWTPPPNQTATAAYELFLTQSAATPTPNLTETLAACEFEYIVAQPNKHDQPPLPDEASNPRLVRFNQDFAFALVFRNTGTCNWPRRARLAFDAELTAHPDDSVDLAAVRDVCAAEEIRPGVNFAAQQQSNFYVESAVTITQDSLPVQFTGTAPRLYGCYYGVWRLLYPGSDTLLIGRPLVLAIRVWGGAQ